MEMKNKLHYYKNKHTMDTSSCQISVKQWQPLINGRVRDIWVISHKKTIPRKIQADTFFLWLCNKQKLAKEGPTRPTSVDPEILAKEDA